MTCRDEGYRATSALMTSFVDDHEVVLALLHLRNKVVVGLITFPLYPGFRAYIAEAIEEHMFSNFLFEPPPLRHVTIILYIVNFFFFSISKLTDVVKDKSLTTSTLYFVSLYMH
jgi:hypothetical protein